MSDSPAPTAAPPPAETADEKWKRRAFYLSLVSSVVLVLGGLGSVYHYTAQQRQLAAGQIKQQEKEAEQRAEAAKAEADRRAEQAGRVLAQQQIESELRRRELALMIYREKKEAYGLLVDAATDVATAKNRAAVEEKAGKFMAVYYGRIHIIPELDPPVQAAKNRFKTRLDEYLAETRPDPPINVFSSPLIDLSGACQKGLDVHRLFEGREPARPGTIPRLPFGIPLP